MADVKKREKQPVEPAPMQGLVEREPPQEVKIKVGDKVYPLPTLTYGEYKKLAKMIDEMPKAEDLGELELLEYTRDFYYKLLKGDNPELKKSDLDDMPLYQMGSEFYIKIKIALMRTPLGS
jgi:hypothetical protein